MPYAGPDLIFLIRDRSRWCDSAEETIRRKKKARDGLGSNNLKEKKLHEPARRIRGAGADGDQRRERGGGRIKFKVGMEP